MQKGYLPSRVLGTFFSPEAIWTYWLIQVEWVQIPLYHCTLPLAIVSFQEKNKQPVIRFIFLQTLISLAVVVRAVSWILPL